jgi:hypothetical protein
VTAHGEPSPERRRETDRRNGDRRRAQAAVLHHRRATDQRLDLAGVTLRLQRSAFERAAAAPPVPRPVVIDLVDRQIDLEPEAAPEPVVDLVRCPLCEVLHDRLWLFAHVARDHRGGAPARRPQP